MEGSYIIPEIHTPEQPKESHLSFLFFCRYLFQALGWAKAEYEQYLESNDSGVES